MTDTDPLVKPEDLLVFDATIPGPKAQKMIEMATAEALRVAPCLATITDSLIREQASGIITRAILRWNESGSGALQQWANTDGPFTRSGSLDTRTAASHGIFYPSEETALKSLCPGAGSRRVKTAWLL